MYKSEHVRTMYVFTVVRLFTETFIFQHIRNYGIALITAQFLLQALRPIGAHLKKKKTNADAQLKKTTTYKYVMKFNLYIN